MSKKAFTKAEAEQRLRAKNFDDDLLKRLPPDVNVALAATRALESLENSAWRFARVCQRLPPSVIAEVLARLERQQKPDAEALFLREAMRLMETVPLDEAWRRALVALLDLDTTYAWGSKQKRAKFASLAGDPVMRAAIAAAVVGATEPTQDMLGVLATVGDEASADALLGVFAGGKRDHALAELKTHAARTPAMQALLSGVGTRLKAKEAASPAFTFAREVLGLEVPKLSFSISINSVETNRNRVPRYQGSFTINASWAEWWSVHLSRVDDSLEHASTHFGAGGRGRDDLKVGTCAPEELPRWVATAGKKLKVKWFVGLPYGSLRGKKRELVSAWLFGG